MTTNNLMSEGVLQKMFDEWINVGAVIFFFLLRNFYLFNVDIQDRDPNCNTICIFT